MRGSEILALVQDTLADEDVPESSKILLINDAIADISSKAPRLDRATLNFGPNVTSFNFSAIHPKFKEVEVLKRGLYQLDFRPFRKIPDLSYEGVPDSYYFIGNVLYLYPVPNVEGELDLIYRRGYPTITSIGQVINEPDPMTIAYYVAWKVCDSDEVGRVQMLEREYLNKLADLAVMSLSDNKEYIQTVDVLPRKKRRWG